MVVRAPETLLARPFTPEEPKAFIKKGSAGNYFPLVDLHIEPFSWYFPQWDGVCWIEVI